MLAIDYLFNSVGAIKFRLDPANVYPLRSIYDPMVLSIAITTCSSPGRRRMFLSLHRAICNRLAGRYKPGCSDMTVSLPGPTTLTEIFWARIRTVRIVQIAHIISRNKLSLHLFNFYFFHSNDIHTALICTNMHNKGDMTILQPLLTTSRPLDTTSSGISLIF